MTLPEQPVKAPAPIVVDSLAEPIVAHEKPLLVDTVRVDSIPAVQQPVEEQGLTLKEIQEIRKQEAAAEEAKRKEEEEAKKPKEPTEVELLQKILDKMEQR